jgi:Intracellular proteinase inhibitor
MLTRALSPALMLLLLAGCASRHLPGRVPYARRGNTSAAVAAKPEKGNPNGPIRGSVAYGIEVRLEVNPQVVRLADTRAIEARLVLINRTKNTINLYFNDSHRYDFILRDATGKKLVQWSDDQPVNQNLGTAIMNPQERAEFTGTVSTRDMVAGRTYTLEGLVVGYDRLRQTISIPAVP